MESGMRAMIAAAEMHNGWRVLEPFRSGGGLGARQSLQLYFSFRRERASSLANSDTLVLNTNSVAACAERQKTCLSPEAEPTPAFGLF